VKYRAQSLMLLTLSASVLLSSQILRAANPVPLLIQVGPSSVEPGGPAFTLHVFGSGFVSGSVVNWNGGARTTTFQSSSVVSASILASDIASAGTASITVVNPAPGGGASNAVFLPVNTTIPRVTLTSSNFDAGTASTAVATGDFNGDGKLDLAAVDVGSNQLGIILGNGEGTFQPPLAFAVGTQPLSVATGDFNGDGYLDVVTANQDDCSSGTGSVSILLGNGDGTLQSQVQFGVGNCPQMAIVADFNGDGKLDLAVVNLGDSTVSILLGSGDGTFQPRMNYPTDANPNSLTTGDFNHDGKLDLAVGTPEGVSILLGKGDGTFRPQTSFPSAARFSITTADLNGDGKLDLFGANDDGTGGGAVVMLGNGDGTFGAGTLYFTGRNPVYVTMGDFSNDGRLDLAVTSSNANTLSILFGLGNGTFKEPAAYFNTGPTPDALAVGDFNGDGRLDVVVLVANQASRGSLFSQ
jgi:hypothetical protein